MEAAALQLLTNKSFCFECRLIASLQTLL